MKNVNTPANQIKIVSGHAKSGLKKSLRNHSRFFAGQNSNTWHVKITEFEKRQKIYKILKRFHKFLVFVESYEKAIKALTLIASCIIFSLLAILHKYNFDNYFTPFVCLTAAIIFFADIFTVFCFLSVKIYKASENASDPLLFIKNNLPIDCLERFSNDIINTTIHKFKYEPICISKKNQKSLKELAHKGHLAYGDKNINEFIRFRYYLKLEKIRKGTVNVIKDLSGEIIAFFIVIPMSTNPTKNGLLHINGKKIDQFDLSSSEIATKGKTTCIFIQSLYIDPGYLNDSDVFVFLIQSLVAKIASLLVTDEIALSHARIYQQPNTEGDAELFRLLGFKHYNGKSLSGDKFYEIRFIDEDDDSEKAKLFKKIIRIYMERVNKS